jgi:hypothetical protein
MLSSQAEGAAIAQAMLRCSGKDLDRYVAKHFARHRCPSYLPIRTRNLGEHDAEYKVYIASAICRFCFPIQGKNTPCAY